MEEKVWQDMEEKGSKVRSAWKGWQEEADHARQAKDVLKEVRYCMKLAVAQMDVAKIIGQECDEKFKRFLKGTEVTWKEAVCWAHRCLKRVLEQNGMEEVVKKPSFRSLQQSIVLACANQARSLLHEDAIDTAALFLEVKPAEASIEELQVHMIRGIARFYLGSPAAVQDFSAALDIAQKLKRKEFEAEAWFAKGYVLFFVDPLEYKDDVYTCFTKCLEILQTEKNTARVDSVGAIFERIAERYENDFAPQYEFKNPEAEIERLMKAEEEASSARDESRYGLADVKQALGYWLFHKKMLVEAEGKFKQAVNLRTEVLQKDSVYHVLAGRSLASAYIQLQSCLVEQGKPLEALMWAERGRVRALRIRVDTASFSPEWCTSHVKEFEQFQENDEFAQRKIMEALDGCSGSVVAVEYSFVSTTLLIWVVKQGTLLPKLYQVPLDKIEFPLINGLEVEKVPFTIFELVDVLLETISTSDCSNRATAPYLTFFHNLLMEPIKEELTGYDTILVIPVQALNRLPWNALIDPRQEDAQRYLVQRHVVLCEPSLYLLGVFNERLEENTKIECCRDDEVLLVSNPWPLSLPKLNSLSSAEKEVADICKLVKRYTGLVPRVYNRGSASRAAVLDNLRSAKWVHMACHNILNDFYSAGALMLSRPNRNAWKFFEPLNRSAWNKPPDVLDIQLESGRVLRTPINIESLVGHTMDGLSSQEEMRRGVLSARQLANIPLQAHGVVLSACSTGDGVLISEEGILGLAQALLVAGTPGVLLSLWDVLDGQTHELMTHIYKNLIEGDPKTYNLAFAVREAMKSMIGKPHVEVRHWAAFQIIGAPDVTFPVAKRPAKRQDCKVRGWSLKNISIASLVLAGVAVFLAIHFAISYNQL